MALTMRLALHLRGACAASAATAVLLAAGCGDDEPRGKPAAATATTGTAAATAPAPTTTPAPGADHSRENAKTRRPRLTGLAAQVPPLAAALDRVVVLYGQGRGDKALDLAAEIYVERFEALEGPIAAKDPELMEEVERGIAVTLRDTIRASGPVSTVRAVVAKIKGRLPAVERALGGPGTTKY